MHRRAEARVDAVSTSRRATNASCARADHGAAGRRPAPTSMWRRRKLELPVVPMLEERWSVVAAHAPSPPDALQRTAHTTGWVEAPVEPPARPAPRRWRTHGLPRMRHRPRCPSNLPLSSSRLTNLLTAVRSVVAPLRASNVGSVHVRGSSSQISRSLTWHGVVVQRQPTVTLTESSMCSVVSRRGRESRPSPSFRGAGHLGTLESVVGFVVSVPRLPLHGLERGRPVDPRFRTARQAVVVGGSGECALPEPRAPGLNSRQRGC